MGVEERGDRFQELEESYKDYTVYDQHYERIGKVDDLFVDEHDQPEYIGVKTGFLGMKSTLIPMEIARVNDLRRLVEVAADKNTITEGPAFDDDEEITRDHEARIYGYYGLTHPGFQEGRGGYGDYYDSEEPSRRGPGWVRGHAVRRAQGGVAGATRAGSPRRRARRRIARKVQPETRARASRSRPTPRPHGEPQQTGDTGEAGTGSSLRVRKRVRTDNR